MAQTTKKPARGKAAPQNRFVWRVFLRNRVNELGAAGCLILCAMLTAAIATYSPTDPSFNHSGGEDVTNAMGVVGSYLSDLLLQATGLGSVFLLLVLLGWGWRLSTKRHTRGWPRRVVAAAIGLVTASALTQAIPPSAGWPVQSGMGGAVGWLVYSKLSTLGGSVGATLIALGATVAALPFAMALKRTEWMAIGLTCYAGWLQVKRAGTMARALWTGDSDMAAPAAKRQRRVRVREEEAPKLHVKKVAKKTIETAPETKDVPAQSSFDLQEHYGDFEMPSTNLLSKPKVKAKKKQPNENSLSQNAELLEQTLKDFGVNGEIIRVRPGPVVTLYELEPAAGTKSSRVIGLADDIARSMSATSARISVIPGKNALGIELPNTQREMVAIREMFESETYQRCDMKLPLVLGKDIGGEPIIADLARMPHLLVAGTTGSGKSVAINTMLMSLMYHLPPEQCKFIMIDPKMLELSVYDGIPHLLSPVVTEPGKAVVALKWTVKEMENRYRLMSNLGVRNIDNYNKRIKQAAAEGEELFRTVQTGFDPETGKPVMEKVAIDMNPLPFIVVVVDEMADLMLVAGKDIEGSIQRLAQMARAAGIHIIMATQRPSVDVITGVIKANFPTRISFQVTSKIDSRTILGEQGAEQLLGQGDMLYMAGGGRVTRVHGPFISDKEVEEVISHLKSQGEPVYVEDVTAADDEDFEANLASIDGDDSDGNLYEQAVRIVMNDQKASTSYIQRKLKIGYNRAARLIDRMEEEGIVGEANHVGKREVLMRQAG
jgi:S-DNA-T family DNA segregation ATPase FtsK/SpoIIIE